MSLPAKKSTLTKARNRLEGLHADAQGALTDERASSRDPSILQNFRLEVANHAHNLDAYVLKVRRAIDDLTNALSPDTLSPEETVQFNEQMADISSKTEDSEFLSLQLTNLLRTLNQGSTRSRRPHEQVVEAGEQAAEPHAQQNETDLDRDRSMSNASLQSVLEKLVLKVTDDRGHLKPLPIPVFKGDPWAWEEFWCSFSTNVDKKSTLSDGEKMQYLVDRLAGDAKRAVAKFRISAQNYSSAVQTLETKYNRTEVIVHELSKKLDSLSASSSSAKDQIALLEEIAVIVEQLDVHSEAPQGTLALNKILAKFGRDFQRKLLRKKAREQADDATWFWDIQWLIEKMQEILDEEEDIERTLELTAPVKDLSKGHEQMKSKDTKKGSSTKFQSNSRGELSGKQSMSNPKCTYCRDTGHRSEDCRTVATVDDRIQWLKQENRCFNCLRSGHTTQNCDSKGTCRNDNKRHHTSLCRGKGSLTTATSSASSPQSKPQKAIPSSGNTVKGHMQKSSGTGKAQTMCSVATNGSASALSQHTVVLSEEFLPRDEVTQQDTTILSVDGHEIEYTRNKQPSAIMLIGQARMWFPATQRLEKVEILLDTAANKSFVTAELATRADLPIIGQSSLRVQGFAGHQSSEMKEVVALTFFDKDDVAHRLELFKADLITTRLAQPSLTEADWAYLGEKGLELSLPPAGSSVQPHILVGMDQLHKIWPTEYRLPSGPQIFPTRLGYVIGGVTRSPCEFTNGCALTVMAEASDEEAFKEAVREPPFSDDGVATAPNEFLGTEKDEKALIEEKVRKSFTDSVQKRDDGYYVRLPWKEDHPPLPHNHSIALKRLESVLRQLKGDPELLSQYHSTFVDQLSKGILEEVPNNELQTSNTIHYIPHQPVVTPNKETTKLRVVFDASAHFKDKPCLNDVVHQGPLILPDLNGLLLRFRANKVAFISDVEKAFLQVRLQEADRDACRCLWIRDPSQPVEPSNIVVYRFTRVTFGINASPFLLAATIEHHLKVSENLPDGLRQEISANLYVDNLLTTACDVEAAKQKYKVIKGTFTELNMNIREFVSNDEDLMKMFEEKDRAKNLCPSVLGLSWDTATDTLLPKTSIPEKAVVTRRTMAQQLNSFFDPLGWYSPILLPGKMIMRRAVIENQDWDVPVAPELAEEWRNFTSSVRDFDHRLPRKVTSEGKDHRLVVFSDSSKEAMACCVYLSDGDRLHLLMAKSHVVPNGMLATIPKLEMLALHLAVQQAKEVLQWLKDTVNISSVSFLSDSEICLGWLRRTPDRKETGTMVQNRIRSIRIMITDISADCDDIQFGYIATSDNPADCATRGVHPPDFRQHIWWNGPDYATFSKENWPSHTKWFSLPDDVTGELEAMTATTVALTVQSEEKDPSELIDFDRVRRVHREGSNCHVVLDAVRRTTFVLRFVKKLCRSSTSEKLKKLRQKLECFSDTADSRLMTRQELLVAESMLLQFHQRSHFSENQLKSMKDLDVRMDQLGVYQCFGRLQNSDVPPTATTMPALISPKTDFARAIIEDAHLKSMHAGVSQTMAEVRTKYWIARLRQQARAVVQKCVRCQKFNNHCFPYPVSNQLPTSRVQRSQPFSHVGLDYFGPLTLRKGDEGAPTTAFGCIYTCFTTRLVHLELVPDGTTVSFLNALRRVFSRRGVPQTIYCDNAPTFILGEEILKDAVNRWTGQGEFHRLICEKAIEWKHITPYAPWQGGLYERLIRDVKHSLHKTFGKRIQDYDSLQTILSEIEATLNSRPLTYQEEKWEDQPLLRPIDLLQRDLCVSVPIETMAEAENEEEYLPPSEQLTLMTRQHAVEALSSSYELTERFWNLWQSQYITSLRERHKRALGSSLGNRLSPRVGGCVLVSDPNLPRNCWRVARIVTVFQSTSDGAIREVELRTPSGRTLRRPVNLLVPFELDGNEFSDDVPVEAPVLERETPNEEKPAYSLRPRKHVDYREVNDDDDEAVAMVVQAEPNERPSPKMFSRRPLFNFSWWLLISIILLAQTAASQSVLPTLTIGNASGSIQCSGTGVVIQSQNLRSMSICAEEFCQEWSETPPEKAHVRFPAEILLHGHRVTWKASNGESVASSEIWCSSKNFCESIDCTFCTAAVFNPECNPAWSIAVVTLFFYILLMGCYSCCYVPVVVGAPLRFTCSFAYLVLKSMLKLSWKCLARLCRNPGGGRDRHREEMKKWLLEAPVVMAVVVCVLVGQATACQDVDFMSQQQTKCFMKDNTEFCQVETTEILKLSPLRRDACIRLMSNSTVVAQMSVRWKRLELVCEQDTLFFTRDVDVQVLDSKRCPRTGSCIGNKCLDVKEDTILPELTKANPFPGRTGCAESCGGPGCDCLFLSSGCLFYRVFGVPRDEILYRMFWCNRWREQLVLTVSQADKSYTRVMVPNVPETIPGATITLTGVELPPLRALRDTFVDDGNNVAIWPHQTKPPLRCDSEEQARNLSCPLIDDCICEPAEVRMKCRCSNYDIGNEFVKMANHLPVSTPALTLRADNGSVRAEVDSLSSAELIIHWKDRVQVVSEISDDRCRVEDGHVVGCYNCAKGGVTKLMCTSQQGKVRAEVDCGETSFSLQCSPKGSPNFIRIPSTKAQVRLWCSVKCGQTPTTFEITGILKYTTSLVESYRRIVEGESTIYSEIQLPDFAHIIEVYLHWYKIVVIAVAILASAVLLTYLYVCTFFGTIATFFCKALCRSLACIGGCLLRFFRAFRKPTKSAEKLL